MSTYEISKSSLLSLKAEILRKQEEVGKVKIQNNAKIIQQTKKHTPLDIKNKGVDKRVLNDFVEDEDLLRKSREALEAKTKLYNKLSQNSFSDDEEENKRYLVQFEKKTKSYRDLKKKNNDKYVESEEEEVCDDNYEPASNPDEEWVEYTDCLGRTRKCLRKDLDYLKLNDAALKSKVDSKEVDSSERPDEVEKNKPVEEETQEFDENSELLSGDMRRELQRKRWEIEEEELKDKKNIHYQDILFNEARSHGVGYYEFSKDEDERKKQQEALNKLRQDTQQQQKKAQELKLLRERQLKARMRAAKNRKRARAGLPPLEESDEEVPTEEVVEKETPVENVEEEKKEKARQQHIRPWDIGKKGIKEHYEHTQEEWVDKKRKERPYEFAPPSSYRRKSLSEDIPDKKSLYFTTKKKESTSSEYKSSDKNKPAHINPYKTKETYDIINPRKHQDTPIRNECIDFDDETLDSTDSEENDTRGRGAEIEPPSTFAYNTPNSNRKRKQEKNPNIEESIDAGLKFLRMQTEKKQKKQHPSEVFLF